MYPDPHIPSARIARVIEGGKATELPRRILFLIMTSIALVVVSLTALGVSVMQQAHLQAQREEAERNQDSIANTDRLQDPRYSTRSDPTRLP